MAVQLVFDSTEHFTDLVEAQDYRLAKTFAESMLQHIYNPDKKITVAEIYFEEEDEILDFQVERKNIIPNLKQFLRIYETEEDYEGCTVIANAIKTLECLV